MERFNGDHPGSCTEPLISHVLSERLSRNPRGARKKRLCSASLSRTEARSQPIISAFQRCRQERIEDHNALKNGLEIYNKYAEKQINEAFGDHHYWSVFENEHTPAGLTCGKLTGISVLFKSCAKLKSIDSCA